MKYCNKCKVEKPFSDFYKRKTTLDGYRFRCKKCEIEDTTEYQRTRHGIVFKLYNQQKSSSKKRKHCLPSYSIDEFRNWLYSQPKFDLLYCNWIDSDFNRKLAPSVDRENNEIGYSIDNLTLMTWEENRINYKDGVISGKDKHTSVFISQYTLTGEFVASFHSIHEAGRRTGINYRNIQTVCSGKRKKAGGFNWRYNEK